MMEKAGLSDIRPGDIVTIEPDRVMSHDNTAAIAREFKKTGVREVWNKDKITIIFDHCVPAQTLEHAQNHQQARDFVAEHGLKHFYDINVGVSHQVMAEKGYVLPGQVILGADSHSTLYGAFNALGIPINRTEMAGIWATGKIWLKVPQTINIQMNGRLPKVVYSKDLILKILADIKSDG